MTSSGESSDSWDYLFQPSTEELLAPPPSPPPHRRILRKQNQGIIGEPAFDSEVVPSSLLEIAPILRVANEVEPSNPRVAYLCRYHAFMKSHKLDPTASGRGVLQFKTALLQRLERDNDPTLARRVKKSDVREMQSFYQDYYKKYIQSLQSSADKADSKQLSKAYRTASILFEVLKAINQAETVENEEEMLEAHAHHKVSQKTTEIYVPYNILPLDPDGANQAIMRFPEIQAAVVALRYTRGLPWQREYKRKKQDDILDWLQVMFGFQKDNVANQREHLILLLANVHIRQIPKPDQQPKLDDHALDDVMNKLLKNYKNWCKYLDKKSSLWLPIIQPEVQQRKLLYVSLYLLIWGEAANLRFMPECLCYIYHHMAFEMHGILVGNVSPVTGEDVKPAYGGDEEAFLKKVIYPIYEVIANEAAMSKIEKSKHSKWRNYDDLNEYFWSADCFRLGWPMSDAADFFCEPMKPQHFEKKGVKKPSGKVRWAGKVNFVEIRSYWHIFRSFDRMWRFFILCLQKGTVLVWWLHSGLQSFLCILWIPKSGMLFSLHCLEASLGHLVVSIQTLGMLRSRFQSLPGVVNACLISHQKTREGRKATFFRNSAARSPILNQAFYQICVASIVLTAYYSEEVLFSLHALQVENEAGMSLLFYLQKIYPDEWNNFLERMGCYGIDDLLGNNEIKDDLRLWASYREQTLTRTVRGMMYYRQALELQAFLDMAEDEDLKEGFKPTKLNEDQMKVKSARSLLAQCQAVADMKFTYVVSGQRYGFQKQSQDPQAQDVLRLLTEYPSLRVAYIDEVEERSRDATIKVYYSTLVKAMPNSYYKTVQNSEQALSFVRVRRGDNFDLFFRLIKGVTICVSVLVILKALVDMTLQDIVVCFLAFIPAGWGLILIAQACKPVVKRAGLWGSVITLARGYEMAMGLVVFAPVAFIARFPFVSEFQTHMLFSQAFSRGLQISLILGSRGGKDQSARNV
ncbi:hypothetical protein R6Q59_008572 [Mikania micrantha]